MYNSFTEGGMNCIDVKEFWATLKINWFRHSINLWVDILKEELAPHSIAPPSDNLDMADHKINSIAHKVEHPFWREALSTLANCKCAFALSNKESFLKTSVINCDLFPKLPAGPNSVCTPLQQKDFDPTTQKLTVADFLDANGETPKSIDQLKDCNISSRSFLTIPTLQYNIQKLLTKYNPPTFKDKISSFGPFVLSRKGSGPFRKLLGKFKNVKLEDDSITDKWHSRIGCSYSIDDWKSAFALIQKIWINPDFLFTQFKIINQIMGVG